MSFRAVITNTPSLGQFGHLRQMLTRHWGVEISEVSLAEPVEVRGNGYSAWISFVAPTYEKRVMPRIEVGRAYSLEEMRNTVGPIWDGDTVTVIEFNVLGAGDSFGMLCSFSEQHGFDLQEKFTGDRVHLNRPEDSVLYSLYLLEREIGPGQDG